MMRKGFPGTTKRGDTGRRTSVGPVDDVTFVTSMVLKEEMNKNSKLEESKYCTGGREPTRKRGTKVGE
jgi:hypothetical protein